MPPHQASEPASSRIPGHADPGLGFRAFVALIAAIMACNALQIDSMLPALPVIGRALGVARENERQWIIAIYVLGFGVMQIVYGPLADRYGRRPVLVVSLVLNALASLWAALAGDFAGMLVARLLQGATGAAGRVLIISIVRDCYQGRAMARVMSLAFMTFLAVPILAPSIGQLIMLVASWRVLFLALAGFAGLVAVVGALRLKETLHPEHLRPISLAGVTAAMRRTLTDRTALGYTLGGTVMYGSMMGYINSVEQIFTDIFHAPALFPLVFAAAAVAMGVAAFLNARVVEALGTRRVSQAALIGFMLVALAHVAVAARGYETMLSFAILQSLAMFCFGLIGSNFGSMAMETVGDIAGTASSVQGVVSTCGGAIIGIVIGQSFNGTTVPLAAGTLGVSVAAFACVIFAESGRLFRAHHAEPQPAQ